VCSEGPGRGEYSGGTRGYYTSTTGTLGVLQGIQEGYYMGSYYWVLCGTTREHGALWGYCGVLEGYLGGRYCGYTCGGGDFAQPATRAALAFYVCAIGWSRALAAGVTWRLVIASAPWAAREGHTSVIDAAGAIYVLGGHYSFAAITSTFLNDVWVSTDGGARPDSVRVLKGVILAYSGVPWGTKW
jgi:hypothetical protein